jgi:glycine cleavage system aminomethyltransferase T
MADAVDREVAAARSHVAILDARTLGKIDLQGRDVAEFLNRVYTNAWSKLAIGRCRYGLMLGEDGMVFDDGVTTRLAERHYLMSTTSGGAARVLAWLEEWLQTEWPDLQVFCTSVTEQWATISLSGPESRKLVSELVDIDLDPEAFPHMSVRLGQAAGVPARIFRISFTGEQGYEIQVPAGYGLPLWERCIAAGEKYGITPYGTEAMHVLRAEKGYIIAGQDTDGTVTPDDLGMGWIVARQKPDFIGKRSLARADIARDDRKQLVGLVPDDARAAGGRGSDRGRTLANDPGDNDRARHLELSQPEPRPYLRAGPGRARPRPARPEAVRAHAGADDRRDRDRAHVHRQGRGAAAWLRQRSRRSPPWTPRHAASGWPSAAWARSPCAAIRPTARSWLRSAASWISCCRASRKPPRARMASPFSGWAPTAGC